MDSAIVAPVGQASALYCVPPNRQGAAKLRIEPMLRCYPENDSSCVTDRVDAVARDDLPTRLDESGKSLFWEKIWIALREPYPETDLGQIDAFHVRTTSLG